MRTAAPSPAVAAGRSTWIGIRPASRRRRPRLTARAVVLLMLVGSVMALSVAPARMYLDQRAELAQMERQAAALQRKNDALSLRADQLRDPAFLERLARQCLGMVKPGETAFVAVPKEGAPAPPPAC